MRAIGKMLQVVGLVLLPFGMMMQLTAGVRAPTGGGFSVSAMLLIMILGAHCVRPRAESMEAYRLTARLIGKQLATESIRPPLSPAQSLPLCPLAEILRNPLHILSSSEFDWPAI